MKRVVIAATLVVSLLLPAAAQADVLVSAVPRHLTCGDAISLGIFAQIGTTGNRTVRMTVIDARTGIVFWRRTAAAPIGRWRDWTLPSGRNGQCGATTVVYRGHQADGSAWTARFRLRFRSEGV